MGPCHLSLPVATLWKGIQKSAVSVSALVGQLSSPAQNSWERQNLPAAVGKVTVPLTTGCADRQPSAFQTSTKVTQCPAMTRKRTWQGAVTCPGRDTALVKWRGHRGCCLLGIDPRECSPAGLRASCPMSCPCLGRWSRLGTSGSLWGFGTNILCVGGVSSQGIPGWAWPPVPLGAQERDLGGLAGSGRT